MQAADVLILGGGGAGTAAALFLARAGQRVILLERGLIGGQASGVNHGGVRQQGRSAAELPLAMRARALWGRMRALVGTDAEFDPCGHLRLARTPEGEAKLVAWAELAANHGLKPRLMGGNAIRHAYPLGPSVIAGSLLAEDGTANPRLLAPAFAAAARAAGATLLEDQSVTEPHHDGARFRLRANGAPVAAPILLNTAGFWGGRIAEHFGEPVPVVAMQPNMQVTEPLPHRLGPNLGVADGALYLRQIPRGNVIFGGGRGIAWDDARRTRPSVAASDATRALVMELLPWLQGALIIRSWTGTDGEMPDSQPVLGPSLTRPGLFHAFGFSGHGFALGPAVGQVLAELVVQGRTDIDLGPFAINRFNQNENRTILG
jgi:sarcosine oxidase subunit beta